MYLYKINKTDFLRSQNENEQEAGNIYLLY